MKVVLRTATQIIVHDGAVRTTLEGALWLAFGGLLAFLAAVRMGWDWSGGHWLIYPVAGGLVFSGLHTIAFAADRRYLVDLSSRTARIIERGLLHGTSRTLPLGTLKDVALERRPGERGSHVYRIVFVATDGELLPWTPNFSSDPAPLIACATQVRVLCGWAESRAPAPSGGARRTGAFSGVFGVDLAFIILVMGSLAVGGLVGLGTDIHRVTTWQPVPAQVVTSYIKTFEGSKGSVSYAPVVVYQYVFAGARHGSDEVFPVTTTGGRAWAEELRSQFRRGQVVTAYVDPQSPSDAFLVKKTRPAMWVLVIVFPLALIGLAWRTARVQTRWVVAGETHEVPMVDVL